MGNCLVMQERVIKVMKTDGKVLEYESPIKVHQVLSDFAGHAISEKLEVVQHLRPDSALVGGRLYYLLPLPVVPEVKKKKRVKFANPEVEASEGSTGVVRIKLVISKQELEKMLSKGGISVDQDMFSQLQRKQISDLNNKFENIEDGDGSTRGWKPDLESISELI